MKKVSLPENHRKSWQRASTAPAASSTALNHHHPSFHQSRQLIELPDEALSNGNGLGMRLMSVKEGIRVHTAATLPDEAIARVDCRRAFLNILKDVYVLRRG